MKTYLICTIGLCLFAGCVSPRYLHKPMEFRYHVKGLYLEYDLDPHNKFIGEIIAVNAEHIVLLPVDTNQSIRTVARSEIPRADIVVSLAYNQSSKIGLWAALINLLSLGHGYYSGISLPLNLFVTTSIANDAAKATYRVQFPEAIDWESLNKFARFPQGLPPQIDRNLLR